MTGIRVEGSLTQELSAFMGEWDSNSPGIKAYTSGSTGAPKQIELSREDMLRSAQTTCRFFGIGRDSLLGLPLSVSYIAGKMMAVRALMSGAALYVESPSNMPLASYDGRQLDLLSVVPSQLPYLLDSGRIEMARALIIGGSPLSPSMEQRLLDCGMRDAYVSYGMTETCSHVAMRPIGCDVYEALEGTQLNVDSRGCMVIDTAGASYSPLVTNDIVELRDSRHFRWLGRADNVVISGGIKLHPELIERKIGDVLGDVAYVVSGRPSEKWGSELIIRIESATPIADVDCRLRRVLSPVEMPKDILYVDELPRTSSGKIKR